jgi:ATP-binding cassette subfamily F protein 3
MAVIRVNNVTKEFGARRVLENVSFEAGGNDKFGLIGINGSGKTTLLRIMLGMEQPTTGSVIRKDGIRIGYVPQYVEFHEDQTVMDFLMNEHRDIEANLRKHEQQLAATGNRVTEKLMRAYESAREEYDRIEGDHYETRALRMLTVFGLAEKQEQPVSDLSGGEQNILAITRALLVYPDVLVLDEPANHLDYLGIAWLEDFLRKYKGALLIVTHNRYLLDQVANGILDLSNGRIERYHGNYTDYQVQKLQARIRQEKEYESSRKKLEKLEAMVLRIRNIAQVYSDKSWGRRLRSRQSQLEKARSTAVERPAADPRKAAIRFDGEATHATIVLRLRNYTKAYGEQLLFDRIDLDITSGERIALVGPNGSGKTSLLRDIMEQGHWDNPVIRIGPSMQIGYCAQQQETLSPGNTIFQEIMISGAHSHQHAREVLARFLFYEDDLQKMVKNLSGGERNRLQLARVMLQKPNVLILDEPTNHLDIQTREAVEDALEEYKGTVLVVSHDRYFLEKLATRVLEVKDRRLYSYQGSYTAFWYTRGLERSQEHQQDEKKQKKKSKKKKLHKRKRPGNPWKIKELEKQIAQYENRVHAREQEAVDAFTRMENERGAELMQQTEELKQQLNAAYEEWLALQEQ